MSLKKTSLFKCSEKNNQRLFLECYKIRQPMRHPYISSPKESGSYTIEVAVILPMFLVFAMLSLFCLKIIHMQWQIENAMTETVNECALCDSEAIEQIAYTKVLLKLKRDQVDFEYLSLAGFSFPSIHVSIENNILSLKVKYHVSYPINLLGRQGFDISIKRCARIWNGYDPSQTENRDGYVYVAKYGSVYHVSRYCTYIDPTIRSVSAETLSAAKNCGGRKYRKCPYCKQEAKIYYITKWGECYHSRITCSALRRTVYKLRLEDAKKSYRSCSKCGS